MISLLTGTIHSVHATGLVILTTGGVGYDVTTTRIFASSQEVGGQVSLCTYLKVSEQAMQLFGFASEEERGFFELLLSVSGVGPKSAMNILALGSVAEIESAVARGDATYLSAVQGIGKKTAERMVVELKSKVRGQGADSGTHANSEVLGEVLDVLVGMGYGRDEVRETLKHIEGDDTEVLLRNALKVLSK